MLKSRPGQRGANGFTLVELMVIIAIIGLLISIIMPTLNAATLAAKNAICESNLKNLQTSFYMYMSQNNNEFFPYQQTVPEGTLWYWGLEAAGGQEGSRSLDKSRAKLAPYFSHCGKMEICPTLPYTAPYFKRKFDIASYGYAINMYMLDDWSDGTKFEQVSSPGETVAWADSIQMNTWQAPASAGNPMLEEWYYLDNRALTPSTFHFRHFRQCNAAFADGSVHQLTAYWLDSRCGGLAGRPEKASTPPDVSPLLKLKR